MGLSENVVYPIVPNGFADHYPVFKWLAIIGNIPNIFRQTHMAMRLKTLGLGFGTLKFRKQRLDAMLDSLNSPRVDQKPLIFFHIYTIWLFNIAMENHHF